MVGKKAFPKTIVYLELVVPHIDTPESRAKWLFWVNRDFPWALREGWSVEYWGLRDRTNHVSSWQQLRVRGPRIPFRRVPRVLLATGAWLTHLALALIGRRPGILLARSPYLGAGAAVARVLQRRSLPLVVRIVERKPSTALRVYGSKSVSRMLDAMERFVLRRANLVLPIAGFTREVAERAGVSAERILELPNPPRWGRIEVPGETKAIPPRVVCAARLTPAKAVDVLIRAFDVLAEEFPDVDLDIAGDGEERAALQELAASLGLQARVRFHGWVSAQEIPRLFATASVAVLPSRVEEGHPMALREAGLAGCALIGTDLGGIRDIVRPGQTGILVPPEDPLALADAIRRLLRDPDEARRLGAAAVTEAVEYFQRRDDAVRRVQELMYALQAGP